MPSQLQPSEAIEAMLAAPSTILPVLGVLVGSWLLLHLVLHVARWRVGDHRVDSFLQSHNLSVSIVRLLPVSPVTHTHAIRSHSCTVTGPAGVGDTTLQWLVGTKRGSCSSHTTSLVHNRCACWCLLASWCHTVAPCHNRQEVSCCYSKSSDVITQLATHCPVPPNSIQSSSTVTEAVATTSTVVQPILPGINFPVSALGWLILGMAIAAVLVHTTIGRFCLSLSQSLCMCGFYPAA